MKILTTECFIDNSGFTFEDLICNLLREEYGNIFQHTGYTNDGGKDFETNDDRVLAYGKTWAECKKYTKSLSYNNVSKTLLMAYVKQINKLLIFSYSPVNSRFYEHIAEYKRRTHIAVEVYDDQNLETLLLKYRNKAWFCQYIDLSLAAQISQGTAGSIAGIKCSYKLSNRKTYQKQYRNVCVDMFEIIALDLLIINHSMQNFIVNIDYSEFDKHAEFELLNKAELIKKENQNRTITKCSSILIKLYVRIVKYQTFYQLPSITIDGKGYRVKDTLHTTWLATTNLIGEVYQNQEEEIINKSTHVKKLLFVAVKGDTGTGKSKFLKELFQTMYGSNYKCFYCDIDTKKITVQLLCRELFSLFTNLPYFKASKRSISDIFLDSKNNAAFELACQILYENEFNFKKNFNIITNCIFDFLKKQSYFIILENIQKYDSLSLDVIKKLIELSSTADCSSVLILSFNTNYIADGTSVHDLLNHIEILNYHKPQRFHIVNLPGFDIKGAKEYICTCLQIPKSEYSDYSRVVSQITERIGTNPLVLQNYLIQLYRSHIAAKNSEHFTIVDLEKFLGNTNVVDENFDHLMDELEQNILEILNVSIDHTASYLHLVGCLSLFRQLNERFIAAMDETHIVTNCLIKYGVVQYDTINGYYRFRHIEYMRYYWNKYNLRYIQHKRALACINTSIFRKKYIECIFLLEFEIEEIETVTLHAIEDKILENQIIYDYLEMVYNQVLAVYYVGFELPSAKHLQVMKSISMTGVHLLGTAKVVDLQKKIFDLLSGHLIYFSLNTNIIIDIFKEFLNHLMNEGRLLEAEKYCQKMQSISNDIPEAGLRQKYLTELLKKQILIFYKKDETDRAINCVENLLKNMKDNTFEYAECLMFFGNIYYHKENFFKYQSLISEYWRNAYSMIQMSISKYESFRYDVRSVILNIIIKNCLVDIFEDGKINQCDRQFLQKIMDNTNMIYFEVKIRQLFSLEHLMNSDCKDAFQTAVKLLKETIDMLSTDYGNKALYAISLFFLAEAYKAQKEYDMMYDYFLSFYGVFLQLYAHNNQRSNDYYLLTEMCNSLRRHREHYSRTFDANILNAIYDQALYDRLTNILYMPDNEFSTYYRNNCQVSLFFCDSTEANYPMI